MTGYARELHLPSSRKFSRNAVLAWALAAAVGMTAAAGTAEAARLGHARVVSAPGAPLQVLVPLLDLTPDETANLRVSLADAAAWQQAGLQPPTPLSDTRATLETGADGSRTVRIASSQAAATDAIDVLLDLQSGAGQRQLQVTVLVPQGNPSAGIQRATTGSASGAGAVGGVSTAGSLKVLPGQTLWGIASSHAVPNTTIYQQLVALWRANPQAFSQNNMNLVRAGSTLALPDAATVQAIDPEEARRIFAEQAEAFQRYRGRLGAGGQRGAAVRGGNGAAGKVESGQTARGASSASAQDQLRLSSASSAEADAKADASASAQHAMEDASKRVDELKSNVDALNQAATAAGTALGAAAGAQTVDAPASDSASAASASAPSAPAESDASAAVGPNSPTAVALDAAKDTAKQVVSKSGMPNWISDNLLAIITGVLAIVIFIVAWMLRRAGQRRNDDDEGAYEYTEPSIDGKSPGLADSKAIDDRISSINLDLDTPVPATGSLGSSPFRDAGSSLDKPAAGEPRPGSRA